MSKLAVITICNDAFADYCSVMIYSFIKNNPWYTGDIIICCDTKEFTLNEQNRQKLKNLYQNIKIREVDQSQYENFINNFRKKKKELRYLPSAYTFEVFDLEGYDKVLYLDADMLIIDSIEDLFDYDCKIGVMALTNEHYKDWEIKVLGKFNLGLVLVDYTKGDLKQVKRDLIKAGEEIDPGKCNLFEQGVFNANVPEGVVELPFKYNFFDKFNRGEKKIIHYVTNKPWKAPTANEHTKLWNKYNNELKNL